ncbi:hypothetical protein ACFLZZ_04515 [Nanoarchaeota archaeon]
MKRKAKKNLTIPKIILWILGIIVLAYVGYLVYFEIFSVCCAQPPIEEAQCVPAGCCHPTSCVSADQALDCSDTFCTEECQDGTMDCGAGSCKFEGGECIVEWKK